VKNPWFPLYVADYLAKTSHLNQAQHGAYMLLMMHYYATGGPIPASAMQVHSICRCTTDAERSAATQVLQMFFTREEAFYRHTRIDEELATRSSLRAKRQNAAQVRWGEKAMQVDMHVHTQSQSHMESLPIKAITHSKKQFVKPSLEEVSAYCKERKNQVDPAKWLDYYTSNGWHVGRNSMKDWRATVRYWERNGFGGPFDDGHKTSTQRRNERNTKAFDRVFGAEETFGGCE
jgi:uncharacterized protein YdaU (DUF1376 family)